MDAGVISAAIDTPTATVVAAIVVFFGTVMVRLIPKTSSESAVDLATAREKDASSWQLLVAALEAAVQRLEEELAEERKQRHAVEERAVRLEIRVAELEAA